MTGPCPDCEQPTCPGYGCMSFQMERSVFAEPDPEEEE